MRDERTIKVSIDGQDCSSGVTLFAAMSGNRVSFRKFSIACAANCVVRFLDSENQPLFPRLYLTGGVPKVLGPFDMNSFGSILDEDVIIWSSVATPLTVSAEMTLIRTDASVPNAVITSVTPSPLVQSQAGVIAGDYFLMNGRTVVSANIDGTAVTIGAVTETSIAFTTPSFGSYPQTNKTLTVVFSSGANATAIVTVNDTLKFSDVVTASAPILWSGLRDTSGTTIADLSGHSRTGTYSGSPTLNQPALVTDPTGSPPPKSVLFGSGKQGLITHASWMDLTDACTLSMWIKVNGMSSDRVIGGCVSLGTIINTAGGYGFYISSGSTDVTAIANINGVFHAIAGGVPVTDNVRHLCVLQYDGVNLSCQVDDQTIQLDSASGTLTASPPDFSLGNTAVPGDLDWPFDGYIEDVVLWNRVLTPAELTDIWNAGK